MATIDGHGITRRGLGGAALAVAVASAVGAAGPASASGRVVLPGPTGPYPIGTVPLHLAGGPDGRELMISVWYPARDAARYPRARWMRAAPLRELLVSADFAADAAAAPLTAGHLGAPARRGKCPVVMFSHGAHDHRADNTIIVQELVSHGYVVVTVDHTGDAFSEFPDGRVIVPDSSMGPGAFAADIRFVLDRVEELAAGRNPDADRRPLPVGLARTLDPHRIGMFGWSKGGTATAIVMTEDPRVRAGLSIDGPMIPAVTADLDRPFMLVTAENTRAASPAVAEFWSHLRGWRLEVRADGAMHGSYEDVQALLPQLAKITGLSDAALHDLIGDLDPGRSVRIQQAYPLAFFDRHLRHRGGHLLDGPSPAFPEVKFLS